MIDVDLIRITGVLWSEFTVIVCERKPARAAIACSIRY